MKQKKGLDEIMAERKMSERGFLHKASSAKVSPVAFLAAHREWLTTGALAEKTSPILAKIDEGSLFPTPGLIEIQNAVYAHHIESELRKGEAAMLKASEPATEKPYVATVFDKDGNIPLVWREKTDPETGVVTGEWKELRKSFELPQRAEEWLERRLFDGSPEWRGECFSTKTNITTHIVRSRAIANQLRKPKSPVCHVKGASSSSLSFGVKAKGDRNVKCNMG